MHNFILHCSILRMSKAGVTSKRKVKQVRVSIEAYQTFHWRTAFKNEHHFPKMATWNCSFLVLLYVMEILFFFSSFVWLNGCLPLDEFFPASVTLPNIYFIINKF